jgi:hypothetical protein
VFSCSLEPPLHYRNYVDFTRKKKKCYCYVKSGYKCTGTEVESADMCYTGSNFVMDVSYMQLDSNNNLCIYMCNPYL